MLINICLCRCPQVQSFWFLLGNHSSHECNVVHAVLLFLDFKCRSAVSLCPKQDTDPRKFSEKFRV